MNTFIPLYFPTNVIFLDDDPLFLNALLLGLEDKTGLYRKHHDPAHLLQTLNSSLDARQIEMKWIACEGHETFGRLILDADISKLHHEIYRGERFNEISVVVVDNQMPEMTGIEFLTRIQLKNVYKVLLTGHADDSVGVEALNEGIIHQFVKKGDLDLPTTLKRVIETGKQHFFSQMASRTLKVLEGDEIFLDPAYLDLVQKILKQVGAVEYYLIDTQGSLLMFNDKGDKHVLFVASEAQQESLTDIATEIGAPADIIQCFRERTKIFCKYSGTDQAWPEVEAWREHLHDARRVDGKNTFYYTVASNCFEIDVTRAQVFGRR
jgi:CheY-like chemotaxis protein